MTRDYVFDVEPESPAGGRAPMLSVFGGKITTYRKLAEHALDKLAPFFPAMRQGWTAKAPLPGGDMPDADFDRFLAGLDARATPGCPTVSPCTMRGSTARVPLPCSAMPQAPPISAGISAGCSMRARSIICAAMSGPRRPRTSSSGGPSIICI